MAVDRRSVCIVTPDIVGPIKNGGIGTHCYYLARTLAEAGFEVTVLFTSICPDGTLDHWKQFYTAFGVTFLSAEDYRTLEVGVSGSWNVKESYQIYQFLLRQDFATIHFQDWQAAGFHSIQAKRTLGQFALTLLTVTLHSPTEWQYEGMRHWPQQPKESAGLQYCERYCCKHADVLISPPQHMLDWCFSRGWTLAERREVIPCCFEPGHERGAPYSPDPQTIAFFGRLETRKGLEVFCGALKLLARDADQPIRSVLFLGKVGQTLSGPADAYIAAQLGGTPFVPEIHSDLDTFAARRLIRERRALVICPSLLDNCPYAVLECIMDGLPVLAANTGGIPELLTADATFSPTPAGIAAAIRSSADATYDTSRFLYDPARSAAAWCEISREPAPPGPEVDEAAAPLVSVCMAHFNHGRHIGSAIDAVLAQTYGNIEILVVDDGSTDPASLSAVRDLESRGLDNLRVVYQEHQGPGGARNHAASLARGEFLIFVDADNLSVPRMVERLVRAALRTNLDIVTCFLKAFPEDTTPTDELTPSYLYFPIGPALELGMSDNVFGDTNFLVRRAVFLEAGGFSNDRPTNDGGAEDWEFLAKAALAGRSQDVLPEPLLWYRLGAASRSRTTIRYSSIRAVSRHYEAALLNGNPWIFRAFLLPLSESHGVLSERLHGLYAEHHAANLTIQERNREIHAANSALHARSEHLHATTLALEHANLRVQEAEAALRATSAQLEAALARPPVPQPLPFLSRRTVRLLAPIEAAIARVFPRDSLVRRGLKRLLRRGGKRAVTPARPPSLQ